MLSLLARFPTAIPRSCACAHIHEIKINLETNDRNSSVSSYTMRLLKPTQPALQAFRWPVTKSRARVHSLVHPLTARTCTRVRTDHLARLGCVSIFSPWDFLVWWGILVCVNSAKVNRSYLPLLAKMCGVWRHKRSYRFSSHEAKPFADFYTEYSSKHGMLVPVRTSVDLRRRNE